MTQTLRLSSVANLLLWHSLRLSTSSESSTEVRIQFLISVLGSLIGLCVIKRHLAILELGFSTHFFSNQKRHEVLRMSWDGAF